MDTYRFHETPVDPHAALAALAAMADDEEHQALDVSTDALDALAMRGPVLVTETRRVFGHVVAVHAVRITSGIGPTRSTRYAPVPTVAAVIADPAITVPSTNCP